MFYQRDMGPFDLLKMSKCFTVLKKHVVLAYDKISITCVFPLTEHKMIVFNDLSSLHFTRKCEDSKRVYRRHTMEYRR